MHTKCYKHITHLHDSVTLFKSAKMQRYNHLKKDSPRKSVVYTATSHFLTVLHDYLNAANNNSSAT